MATPDVTLVPGTSCRLRPQARYWREENEAQPASPEQFNGRGGYTKGRAHWRRESKAMLSPDSVGGLGMDTLPPPLEGERVSLREEGGKTSSAPTPGLYLSQAPGWRGIAGVGWGWSQQKAETSGLPAAKKKKKSIKSPRGPGPSHPSPLPRTKKCKTLSQNGGLRGAPNLGS